MKKHKKSRVYDFLTKKLVNMISDGDNLEFYVKTLMSYQKVRIKIT